MSAPDTRSPTQHAAHAQSGTATLLVACAGTAASHEALLNAASCAATAYHAHVEILGVCAPTPSLAVGMDALPVPMELDESRRVTMLEDVQRCVSIAAAGNPSWTVEVLLGTPARVLAAEAARRNATLLVMGIGRHNPIDRLFGAETTLAALRESIVPVLAVGAQFPQSPTRAVVGLDFSDASIRAAQIAGQLLSPTGTLTLTHVRPRIEYQSADWDAWEAEYTSTVPPMFERVRSRLGVPASMRVETLIVRGDPAPSLLAVAHEQHADLIAVGTQHHGFVDRLVVGSVATQILRTARSAVLAVPAGGQH